MPMRNKGYKGKNASIKTCILICIIRYVNAGLACVCGEILSFAKPKISPAALAKWSRVAKRVRGYFVLFFSCGATPLRVENEPYFSTDKELRGETEPSSHSKEYIEQREKCWHDTIKDIEQLKDYILPNYKGKYTDISLKNFEEHPSQIATLIQNLSH